MPERNSKPTFKQKAAFDKALENGGVISAAMAEAGYSEAMAKNPQKLTESKGWQELMDTHLPDDQLTARHRELLDKREKVIIDRADPKTGESAVYEVLDQPDTVAVSKALDMAYKLKGSYAPEKSVNLNVNTDVKIDAKNKRLIEEYESKLFGQLQNDPEPVSSENRPA